MDLHSSEACKYSSIEQAQDPVTDMFLIMDKQLTKTTEELLNKKKRPILKKLVPIRKPIIEIYPKNDQAPPPKPITHRMKYQST